MKPGRATEPDNEKNQVCGLRARAKGLLADFAPPRKGGGEAGGIRYVAKTGKVLFRLRPNNTFGFLAPDTTFACEDAQNLVCGAFSRANATHLCPPGIVVFQAFWHQIPRISGLFTAPSCLSAHSFLVPGGRDASRMVWVGLWSLHGCLSGHFYAPPATGSLNWYPPGCSGRCHGHRMQRAWEGCLSWEAFPLGLPFPHSLFTPPWPLFMHTGMLRMIIVMPKLLRT